VEPLARREGVVDVQAALLQELLHRLLFPEEHAHSVPPDLSRMRHVLRVDILFREAFEVIV